MNLVIDVGNTRLKYAFFRKEQMILSGFGIEELFLELTATKKWVRKVDIFLSGSGKIDEEVRVKLKAEADYWLEASPHLFLPMELFYETKDTLGFDRIAICVGAMALYPRRDLLVIDSGTALTYNFVNQEGVFLGGNISPGQEIRFRALHQFTDKLPYVDADMKYGECGRNTRDAILNGVMNGLYWEMKGYIDAFLKGKKEGKICLTGGNSPFLINRLSKEVRYEPNLCFVGLNHILVYNKKNN